MAYREVKEPNGEYAIVIDGWEQGTAPDPYSGINRMFAVNLNTPGEVSVGYPITANAVSGATLGNPIARSTRFFTYTTPGVPAGSAQSFAILDTNGRAWESTSITGTYAFLSSGNSLTGSDSNDGISHWLGYLFKTRGTIIDYWNGTTWSTGWQTTLTGSTKHYMYVGSDNVLYITNGNYLASITAPTPTAFDPTNAATYTFSVTKLQLPVTDIALSIAEVGGGNTPQSTLLVGGTQNAIYPWDKVSSSFALPIYVADAYIKTLVSVNQNVFIFPGNQQGRGRIYITNGSQADLYFKIPDYLWGEQDPYYVWGDAIFHRNTLLFGALISKNGGGGVLQGSQLFSINLDTKVFSSVSEVLSPATGTGNATCLISTGSLSSPGLGYIIGYIDNASAPGIGYSGTVAGTGSASIITDRMDIGTFLHKKTFQQVEYKLRSALEAGENIVVIPSTEAGSQTTLTFSPTVTTGAISGVAPVTFQGNQWLQFTITLTGASPTSGVRLKELRLR